MFESSYVLLNFEVLQCDPLSLGVGISDSSLYATGNDLPKSWAVNLIKRNHGPVALHLNSRAHCSS
jgi:hypothetical protein